MILKPHDYQLRGCDLITQYGNAYLMWDMGVGKTLTCILAMKKLSMPVMVLAPLNAALTTWPDELDKWAPDLSYIVLHGPKKNVLAKQAHNYDVVIVNYEGLSWFYKACQDKLLKLKKYFAIWDESSMFKSHNTKRWKILVEANPIWSPYRVCLSGTPTPHGLIDLWSQYYLLDKGHRLGKGFYEYRNTFFNYSGAPMYKTTIRKGSEDLIYSRISDITDRLDGEDYLELPEEVHNDIYMELPKKLRKQYTDFENDFELMFDEGVSVANSSAVLSSKLRQFLQGGVYYEGAQHNTRSVKILHTMKAELLKATIETNPGRSFLVPLQFKYEYDIVCKAFRQTDIPIISGKTSATKSTGLIKKWNAGQIPILLCHPRSVAYSLNLQHGGSTIFWLALPWEMDLYKQLIRRLRRQGQTAKRVIVHRAIFKDTVDERVARVLAQKDATQEDLFNAIKQRRK